MAAAVNPPNLSNEQRRMALVKAGEMRTERKLLNERLKGGDVTLEEFMADPVAARIRVRDMLKQFPGIGPVGAAKAMKEIGIAEGRRVGGLGIRQRDAVIERFGR